MRLVIVTTADASDERKRRTEAILGACKTHPIDVWVDRDPRPGRPVMRPFLEAVIGASKASSLAAVLPDDAIVLPGFDEQMAAFADRFPAPVHCFMAGVRGLPDDVAAYDTPDGFLGFGGMAEASTWRHIADAAELHDCKSVAFDELVSFWLMGTGQACCKPAKTIVGHRDDIPSTSGNSRPDPGIVRSSEPVSDLDMSGRRTGPLMTFRTVHRKWLTTMRPEQRPEHVEAYYRMEGMAT